LGALRETAYGPVWQARVAGVISIIVVATLIAVIALRTARTREPSGIFV
jgi:hypothetical protein